MPLVRIGPLPSWSALAWLGTATDTLQRLKDAPELGVPPAIVALFADYLDQWRVTAQRDPFLWTGEVDPAQARELGAYWFHVVTLARQAGEESGIVPAPPAAEPFYAALVEAIASAAAVADVDHFAEKFEEVVPAFAPPAMTVEPERAPAEHRPAIRVLLVDDTADIRTLLRFTFQHDGRFAVIGEAENGEQALDACADACPDIVLLDLNMPVMDGLTALPLIRERCPASKVIIFSAQYDQKIADRALGLGAVALLSKSIAMQRLTSELISLA